MGLKIWLLSEVNPDSIYRQLLFHLCPMVLYNPFMVAWARGIRRSFSNPVIPRLKITMFNLSMRLMKMLWRYGVSVWGWFCLL